MLKRCVVVLLAVLMAAGVSGWGLAGEGKRRERKKPEPVSVDDYVAAIDELAQVVSELGADDAGAKMQDLKSRAEGALKKLQIPSSRIENYLEADDPKQLAGRLEGYVYASIRGKLGVVRRQVIQEKPEAAAGYKALQEKEKQLQKEREDFYAQLRTMSPELDKLEKKREELDAKREQKRKEAAEKRKKGREPRKRKKE
jgi:hypothetical protein